MAAVVILAGIGVFCWLLYSAAIYALPFFIALTIFFHAEQAGTGVPGAIVLAMAMLVLVLGRTAFVLTRGPILRVAIALAFAAPAALAGYFTTFGLFGLTATSDVWRHAFAMLGAVTVGAVAWQRLVRTQPPANDDNRHYTTQARGQGTRHRALDPRRRPLRRLG